MLSVEEGHAGFARDTRDADCSPLRTDDGPRARLEVGAVTRWRAGLYDYRRRRTVAVMLSIRTSTSRAFVLCTSLVALGACGGPMHTDAGDASSDTVRADTVVGDTNR